MAASQKPEPGTKLTRQQIRDEIRSVPAGVLPDRVKQHLAEVKAINVMAAEISSMNWGKGLSNVMQRAVAEYLRVRGLDVTEIDVLGGNIYRNARYYLRRLSEMTDAGVIEYARPDMVHHDARLDALAKGDDTEATWAREEANRRRRERIAYGIPDAAVGACVFRIKLRDVPVEFSDAKWCGGGTRKSDPVGDQFPIETAITRAARRAMRYIASQIPGLRATEEELDESGVELSSAIKDTHRLELAREVPALSAGPSAIVSDARPTEAAYGDGTSIENVRIGRTAGATEAQIEQLRDLAAHPVNEAQSERVDEALTIGLSEQQAALWIQLMEQAIQQAIQQSPAKAAPSDEDQPAEQLPLGDEPKKPTTRNAVREGR